MECHASLQRITQPTSTNILNQVHNDIILSGTDTLEIEEVIFDLKNSEYTGYKAEFIEALYGRRCSIES
jgi:hypothetical protein